MTRFVIPVALRNISKNFVNPKPNHFGAKNLVMTDLVSVMEIEVAADDADPNPVEDESQRLHQN